MVYARHRKDNVSEAADLRVIHASRDSERGSGISDEFYAIRQEDSNSFNDFTVNLG